jgi:3-hydroxypropanoate dehydrogenase
MSHLLDAADLDLIFREARTFAANPDPWLDRPVSDESLRAAWDLAKMGPTTTNSSPARIVFVRSAEAKEKLRPTLIPGNVEKTMNAPVTAIVAYDLSFFEKLPLLSPHNGAIDWFKDLPDDALNLIALRNGSLQGAYLIIALRALGLDCGPMSGFDNAKVDEAFFPGTRWRSNFLINIGYGRRETLYPRAARLPFDEVCRIV